MVTIGWLLVAAVAVVGGVIACVAAVRAATRRRRSRDAETRERQRFLMHRYVDQGRSGGGPQEIKLPRCDVCGDVLSDVEAMQDHIGHEHPTAA